MSYSLFDHTADLGIDARGADLGEALAEAAMAITEVVTGRPPPPAAEEEVSFAVEAPDKEALVVAFLSEVLWILDQRGLLWCRGGVDVGPKGEGFVASARCNAVRFDPDKGRGVEVKAVTYHALRIEEEGGRVRVKVILDI